MVEANISPEALLLRDETFPSSVLRCGRRELKAGGGMTLVGSFMEGRCGLMPPNTPSRTFQGEREGSGRLGPLTYDVCIGQIQNDKRDGFRDKVE